MELRLYWLCTQTKFELKTFHHQDIIFNQTSKTFNQNLNLCAKPTLFALINYQNLNNKNNLWLKWVLTEQVPWELQL